MHYTSYVVIGGKSSVFRPKSLDRSSPGKQNGLLSRKGTVLHSPADGRSPTRLHSGQCSPGPRDFLLLSAPSEHRRWLTVLTCQLSGVPEEAGWDAAPIQGQEENESVGPKKTVSSINTLRGPRHLSLLPQTQPHLLPGAAEAALQNCLQPAVSFRGRVSYSIWRPRVSQSAGPGRTESREGLETTIRQFPV